MQHDNSSEMVKFVAPVNLFVHILVKAVLRPPWV